jgi:hypothetical protein
MGIELALRGLKLNPELASDRLTPHVSLWGDVCQKIEYSKFLIANISQYGRRGVNPNVTQEAAHAEVKGIPVLFVQCINSQRVGSKTPPANLKERVRWEYRTCADLALKLHYGFKPCMTKSDS